MFEAVKECELVHILEVLAVIDARSSQQVRRPFRIFILLSAAAAIIFSGALFSTKSDRLVPGYGGRPSASACRQFSAGQIKRHAIWECFRRTCRLHDAPAETECWSNFGDVWRDCASVERQEPP